MKYILYGAGRRGKKNLNLLRQHNLEVIGFVDSKKSGSILVDEKIEFPIYTIEQIAEFFDISGNEIEVVISIANNKEYSKVKKLLDEAGITVVNIEDILYDSTDDKVKRNRDYIAEYHEKEMESYFENAETETNLQTFWSEDSIFYQMFSKLDLTKVVELACGRGRHVPKYINNAQEIVLVDILETNIDICKKRLGDFNKIYYYVNNGYDLKELPSNSYTSVFSYDAMVHFEMLDIFSYLKDIERILEPGGMALLHHSNNAADYRITFSTGTHCRNYMSMDLFAHLADRAGLEILSQQSLDWEGVKELDALTLLRKPN